LPIDFYCHKNNLLFLNIVRHVETIKPSMFAHAYHSFG
jgi:hypothetical protein